MPRPNRLRGQRERQVASAPNAVDLDDQPVRPTRTHHQRADEPNDAEEPEEEAVAVDLDAIAVLVLLGAVLADCAEGDDRARDPGQTANRRADDEDDLTGLAGREGVAGRVDELDGVELRASEAVESSLTHVDGTVDEPRGRAEVEHEEAEPAGEGAREKEADERKDLTVSSDGRSARTGFVIWPRSAMPARSASRPLPVPLALMNVFSVTADGHTVRAREMRSIIE